MNIHTAEALLNATGIRAEQLHNAPYDDDRKAFPNRWDKVLYIGHSDYTIDQHISLAEVLTGGTVERVHQEREDYDRFYLILP